MAHALHRILKALRTAESALLVLLLSGMMLLAVLQILLRNFFGTGLTWIDPVIRISVLWIALVGAMIGTREGNHIAIDLLGQYVRGSWKRLVARLANLFAAMVSALMAWVSAYFVYDEYLYSTPAFGALPAWPFEVIMPLGFLVMALRFAVGIVKPIQGEAV